MIYFAIIEVTPITFCISVEYETLDSQKESSFYLDTNGHHGYHGLINEDENNVVVTPTIKVLMHIVRIFTITFKRNFINLFSHEYFC